MPPPSNDVFRPALLKLGLAEILVPFGLRFEMETPVNRDMVILVRTMGVDDFKVGLVWKSPSQSVGVHRTLRVHRTDLEGTVRRIKTRMREFNRLAVDLNEKLCPTCGCPLKDGVCRNSTYCTAWCGGASARLQAAFGASLGPSTQAAYSRAPRAPAKASKLIQREEDCNQAEEPVYSKVPPPELRGLF